MTGIGQPRRASLKTARRFSPKEAEEIYLVLLGCGVFPGG